MSNARRRLLGRTESSDTEASVEEGVEGAYASPRERIADYAGGDETTPDHPAVATEGAVESRASELGNVGAEVESVLVSARAAAARIQAAAETDASRLREQATAAAKDEIADANRATAEARDEAERVRSEAEAYAEQTRSAAETTAEETRADAEGRAAEIVAAAQARLDEAEAEAAQKLRELEGTARERAEHLRAATERHEERLESMLAVFRGVCSQLEELLDARRETVDEDAAQESLENRLRLNVVHSVED